jgi:Fe-S cluster assembly iron-binding protein IscA
VLTLTPSAISAIQNLTARPGIPRDAGLRIAAAATGDGDGRFAMSISSAPQPTDEVVEESGVRIFLDPNASAAFDGKALHADVDGEQVRFELTDSSQQESR